jgi:hypothetical protein
MMQDGDDRKEYAYDAAWDLREAIRCLVQAEGRLGCIGAGDDIKKIQALRGQVLELCVSIEHKLTPQVKG